MQILILIIALGSICRAQEEPADEYNNDEYIVPVTIRQKKQHVEEETFRQEEVIPAPQETCNLWGLNGEFLGFQDLKYQSSL